jgi:hypothetical protein
LRIDNAAFLAAGMAVGLAVTLYESEIQQPTCGVHKVERKVETSYVLKPVVIDAPPVLCPPVAKCEAPKAESEDTKADPEKVIDKPREERAPRKHRRRRHRWRWR